MIRPRRRALIVVVLLVVLVVVVAPRLVDLASPRQRLVAELSQRLGGPVSLHSLHVSLLPLPHVVADDLTLAIPGVIEVTARSVSAYPSLRGLLRGRLEPGTIRIAAPDVILQQSPPQAPGASASPVEWRDGATAALGGLAAVLRTRAPDLTLMVTDGRLRLAAPHAPALVVTDVGVQLRSRPPRISLNLSGASELWQQAALSVSVDPVTFIGDGQITVSGLRPAPLAAPFLPAAGLQLGDSTLDLGVRLTAHGPTAWEAQVDATAPVLTLRHTSDRSAPAFVARALHLQGTWHAAEQETEITLDTLQIEHPTLQLSGKLAFDPSAAHAQLAVQATDIDVAAVREAATVLTGDTGVVGEIFAVLRAGHVTGFSLHSAGHTLADLGDSPALSLHGTLTDGVVQVPGVDLNLVEVSGDATVTGGVLAGSHLAARLDNSRAHDGALQLGLSGAAPQLHVETQVDGDAAELVPLIERLSGGTLPGLDQMRDPQGRAAGTLALSGTTAAVLVAAEVSQLQLTMRVRGLQDLVRIAGGPLSYAAQHLTASNLTLATGGSTFSRVGFNLDWTRTPVSLAVTAADSRIALGEIYPALAATGWLSDVSWAPRGLGGTALLTSLEVTGPASRPAQWRFTVAGAARDLKVDSPALPERAALRSALSLSDARVQRDAAGSIGFSGTLSAANNLTAAVDLVWGTQGLRVKRFALRDVESTATGSLSWEPPEIDLTFDGNLGRGTIQAILPDNSYVGGPVSGALRAHIFTDELPRSTVDGQLEAGEVHLPVEGMEPLRAETLAVDGRGGTFRVQAALVGPADSRLLVTGTLTPSAQAMIADLDVAGGHLDWKDLAPFLKASATTPTATAGAPLASDAPHWPPLRGQITVTADSMTYGAYTWKPLHATLDLAARHTTVTVSDAVLCGVAMPAKLVVSADALDLTLPLSAQDAPLDQTMSCLAAAEKGLITGRYTLAGSITAHGAPAELARAARGRVEFHSVAGRIYRIGMAKTVLEVVSIATGAVFNLPNVMQEGLPYDRFTVKGRLQDGTFRLSELLLDGSSTTIVGQGSIDLIAETADLTLLVAPLKTVDSVIARVPILGDWLGNSLVSIPVKVSGPLSKPRVTPLSASAVGDQLLGFLKRTVKLPVKVFDSLPR